MTNEAPSTKFRSSNFERVLIKLTAIQSAGNAKSGQANASRARDVRPAAARWNRTVQKYAAGGFIRSCCEPGRLALRSNPLRHAASEAVKRGRTIQLAQMDVQ